MLFNTQIPLRFKTTEFHHFNWLYNISPCFPINAAKINIITDPKKFYDTLYENFTNANRRISIASLYLGTGSLERKLLQVTKVNLEKQDSLKFKVLLDYQRGTRGEVNSVSLLKEFVDDIPGQCSVSLYQTPRLHGVWSKVLPSRYNELLGLQHMKLYISDDSVLLSGANCSNDYFQQRQDRYVEIKDADLAKFYTELIDEVSDFSKQYTTNGIHERQFSSKEELVQELRNRMSLLIERWKDQQLTKLSSLQNSADDQNDTWIFPLIQMGEFGITQDEQIGRAPLNSSHN